MEAILLYFWGFTVYYYLRASWVASPFVLYDFTFPVL
jgi:hypothetical protein